MSLCQFSVDSTLPLPRPRTPLLPNGVNTPLLPPHAEDMIVIVQLPQQQQPLQQLPQLPIQLQLLQKQTQYAQPMMTVQYQAKPVKMEDVWPQYAQPMMTV